MKRTQIQILEEDFEALRKTAAKLDRSIADCIREGITLFLVQSRPPTEDFSEIAGKFPPIPREDTKPHDRWWSESIVQHLGEGPG